MGVRRGRRDPVNLSVGDPLDFWRVELFEPPLRLRLRAEMKLPGVATLNFEIEPAAGGGTTLVMTARFRPRGLLGILYWYSVLPLHHIVFGGMLRGIKRAAEGRQETGAG
jgi:hypothetical protein